VKHDKFMSQKKEKEKKRSMINSGHEHQLLQGIKEHLSNYNYASP